VSLNHFPRVYRLAFLLAPWLIHFFHLDARFRLSWIARSPDSCLQIAPPLCAANFDLFHAGVCSVTECACERLAGVLPCSSEWSFALISPSRACGERICPPRLRFPPAEARRRAWHRFLLVFLRLPFFMCSMMLLVPLLRGDCVDSLLSLFPDLQNWRLGIF